MHDLDAVTVNTSGSFPDVGAVTDLPESALARNQLLAQALARNGCQRALQPGAGLVVLQIATGVLSGAIPLFAYWLGEFVATEHFGHSAARWQLWAPIVLMCVTVLCWIVNAAVTGIRVSYSPLAFAFGLICAILVIAVTVRYRRRRFGHGATVHGATVHGVKRQGGGGNHSDNGSGAGRPQRIPGWQYGASSTPGSIMVPT